jgi:hypothetical protein
MRRTVGDVLDVNVPAPDPWLMGIVAIGAGLAFWWLTPDLVREDEDTSRSVAGRLSPFRLWPVAMRSYYRVGYRLLAITFVVAGTVILGVTASAS